MTAGPAARRAAKGLRSLALASTVALAATGCASRGATTPTEAYDPIEPVNRVMYRVNDLGDRYLLRPVASGYERALPQLMRSSVRNIFSNMLYPVTIANDFLQGKFGQCARDGGRFLLNSTVGLAGIFDPASRIGLAENDEDFDQTLAVWGTGEGPYLMIPFFGPRTLRHLVGDVVDSPLTPFLSVTSGDVDLALGAWAIYQVDKRSRLLDADQQIYESFDPYIFVRDTYLQNRRYRARNGDVPEDQSYLDEAELDEAELDDTGGVEPEAGPR
ncbi:MAG: VacJ family lipoprotein [Gammaproteobacteria bacterium]|nr:VacJ family lipoprotein [Gammaproteobacteria bacterium]